MGTLADAERADHAHRCGCAIYCPYCGRHRSRDSVGHYCKTRGCQNEHGYSNCQWNRVVKRKEVPRG